MGPKSKITAEQRDIDKLRKQVDQLNTKLFIANGCEDLKKTLAMLDLTNNAKGLYDPAD